MAQQFWQRWAREYLQTLQTRNKWQYEQKNLEIDDIVLVHDMNAPRGLWPLGKIVAVYPDKDQRVRQVLVKTRYSVLRRPISKLYRILSAKAADVKY